MTKPPRKREKFDDSSLTKIKRAVAIGRRIKAARQKKELVTKGIGRAVRDNGGGSRTMGDRHIVTDRRYL